MIYALFMFSIYLFLCSSNLHLHQIPSNLHLHSHDICFFYVFDLFIPVFKLNTIRFKFTVLFGTHTLLDKTLRLLQLPTHLSNLTANE